MSELNLKLKTYDQLTFEVSRLNIDKYLLEQKLAQKEYIIKEVREYIEERYNGEVLTHTFDICNVGELLEILDKVD